MLPVYLPVVSSGFRGPKNKLWFTSVDADNFSYGLYRLS